MTVELKGRKLTAIAKTLSPQSPAMAVALKQIAAIYRSFVQLRFDKFSRGQGNWKKLAPATIAARRGPKGVVSILRDKGLLFAALQPTFTGTPGALEQRTTTGIRVGYGGPHRHGTGGGVSIADIASFHNEGSGHLPQRKIIVEPDETTLKLMQKRVDITLQRAMNE
jgi:hypothetical protein